MVGNIAGNHDSRPKGRSTPTDDAKNHPLRITEEFAPVSLPCDAPPVESYKDTKYNPPNDRPHKTTEDSDPVNLRFSAPPRQTPFRDTHKNRTLHIKFTPKVDQQPPLNGENHAPTRPYHHVLPLIGNRPVHVPALAGVHCRSRARHRIDQCSLDVNLGVFPVVEWLLNTTDVGTLASSTLNSPIHSQERNSKANNQQPTTYNQQPTANCQQPTANNNQQPTT